MTARREVEPTEESSHYALARVAQSRNVHVIAGRPGSRSLPGARPGVKLNAK